MSGYHQSALNRAIGCIDTADGALYYRLWGDGSLRENGSPFLTKNNAKRITQARRELDKAKDTLRTALELIRDCDLKFS